MYFLKNKLIYRPQGRLNSRGKLSDTTLNIKTLSKQVSFHSINTESSCENMELGALKVGKSNSRIRVALFTKYHAHGQARGSE